MAKKQKAADLVDQAANGIREVLGSTFGSLPESEYVEKSLDALDLVTEGLKMRQQELQGD